MSTEFDEFIACVSARLCDAEQCQTSVDTRVVANASRSLEAAVDAIRLFICECEGIYQTDVPSHMRDFLVTLQRLERHATEMWESLETKLRTLQRMAFSVATNQSSSVGRPKFVITKDQLEFLRKDIGFSWVDIADLIGVSVSTILRRRHEFGMAIRHNASQITNGELDEVVRSIAREHPSMGTVLVEGILSRSSMNVSRERIRKSLMRIDPINFVRRKHQTINRRKYFAPGPNARWHIDGNHKLFRWRLVVHAGIDGYSRLIVFMQCSTNNKANTVAECFIAAVRQFGWPSRTRTDYGKENVEVARLMVEHRGLNHSSHICGPSVRNQRIERLWRDYFRCVGSVFYDLFVFLEDNGLLSPENNNDLFSLHYVYKPRINNAIRLFKHGWNNHKLRTEHNRTPMQLYTEGMLTLQGSDYTAIMDVFQGQTDEASFAEIDEEEFIPELQTSNDVQVPPVHCPLTQSDFNRLQQTIDPLGRCNNYGISIYMDTKSFVENCLNAT